MENRQLSELLDSLQLSISGDYQQVGEKLQILKEVINFTKLTLQRQAVAASHWKTLLNVIEVEKSILQNPYPSPDKLNLLTDIFRCLRNMCAGCSQDDQLTLSARELLQNPMDILILLIERRSNASDKEVLLLRCCLQFFGNLVCQSVSAKSIVWKLFSERQFFRTLLSDPDSKMREYVTMILFHCMKSEGDNYLLSTPEGSNVLILLTDMMLLDENNIIDWGILLLESIACEETFIEQCYKMLPIKNRLLVLDVIIELFENTTTDIPRISELTLSSFKNIFIENATNIKVPSLKFEALKSIETVRLLNVLCSASINGQLSHILKTYEDLLGISVETLKMVHLLGKQSCNSFSAISSLKGLETCEEIKKSGSYCFKKNLVRLIGNMCAQSRQNQDLVRKLDGIPLLLDCSNLDLRNPYIMQWCIFAIHNVLENNFENQEVLANITVKEELINSPLLNELGLMVGMENGRPVLKCKAH